MNLKKKNFILILFVALLIVGSLTAYAMPAASRGGLEERKHLNYAVNEIGLTYGSSANATIDIMPDLISAYGVDGTEGYVYAKDLNAHMPQTMEETAQMAESRDKWVPIALYKSDGITVVGTFIVGPAAMTYYHGDPGHRDELLPPSFPINESGQTYGSVVYTTPLTEPDLIVVYATNGNRGYVYAKEFDQPYEPLSNHTRSIPVYDVDGKTIVGEFVIQEAIVVSE